MIYWLKVITLVLELVMEGLSQMEAIDRIADRLKTVCGSVVYVIK